MRRVLRGKVETMALLTKKETRAARRPELVRLCGTACLLGGALWLVAGSVSLLAAFQPGEEAFVAGELLFVVVQLLLLAGVVGLALSGAAPGWFGGVALGIALLGRADFVAAEVHSLLIGDLSVLLPIGALVTAVGMTLVGVAVLRARRWSGWRRFAPLLAGIYPFVTMFPFIFITSEPSFLAIAGWGLPWLLLGYAMRSEAHETRAS
jgi:hypothetical protein